MIWTSKLVLKKIITVYQNKVASTVTSKDPIGAPASYFSIVALSKQHDIVSSYKETSLQSSFWSKSTNKWVSIRIFKETK
jgi:hypothetical protein